MSELLPTLIASILAFAAADAGAASKPPAAARVVTLGGAITETVIALGAGSSIVAVDDSSASIEEVRSLRKVGYYRSLSAEGILSLQPTLVIGTSETGPPSTVEQLRQAGTRLILTTGDATAEGAKERIRAVATALGREVAGATLVEELEREIEAVARAGSEGPKPNPNPNPNPKPKVLFLFAPEKNVLSAAGEKTAAAEMLRLVGATNAVRGYDGYKPLSAEAAIVAAPDVILVTSSTLARLGGVEGVLALPGLATTPAGAAKRVVDMDDLFLLGFGPHTGAAARTLREKLQVSGP